MGESLLEIVAGMIDHFEGMETGNKVRRRKRQGKVQAAFEEAVAILTANLAYAVLNPPEPDGPLAIRYGNLTKPLTRHDNRPMNGKTTRKVIDLMTKAGFALLQAPKAMRGEVSSIAPTPKLADMVRSGGVTLGDFGRHRDEEPLLLTYWTGAEGAPYREQVDYKDTPITDAMRDAMKRLNGFLAAADVTFVDDGLLPRVDAKARRLTRFFQIEKGEAHSFDRVGRLFGGFWTNLSSKRRQGLHIDGEPPADLDYVSMFCRLGYAHVGKEPPAGDLYALEGLDEYRSGVKLAVNSLFWDRSRRRKSWPEEMGVGVGTDAEAKREPHGHAAGFTGRLPAGWETAARLKAALLQKHPDLAPIFGRGVGASLMFHESEIMMAVLADLMRQGVVALPLHDGLMVGRSKAENAKETMKRVAREMTGIEFAVEEK